MDPKRIAEVFKKVLKKRPKPYNTQAWLGKQIGCRQGTISKYLKGESPIPSQPLLKICAVLGLWIRIEGVEDPWDLSLALRKIRDLHKLSPERVSELTGRIEAVIASYEALRGVASKKAKAASDGGKKERSA